MIALLGALAIGILGFGAAFVPAVPAAGPEVSFSRQVKPIFAEHCTECHKPGALADVAIQLDLTSYAGLFPRSAHGVVVVPHHAANSPLMRVIDTNWNSGAANVLKMPPLGPKLSQDEIDLIRTWIDQGARNN